MNQPQPGEFPLKQWVTEIAIRDGITPDGVRMRLRNGKMTPRLRKVNKRLVFVVTENL